MTARHSWIYSCPSLAEDKQFMRDDVNDPKMVNGWIDDLDYDRVMPLVAVVGSRIVGNATMHFKTGPARHRAEVRIFLAKDFRQRGVGSRMIQGLIELAKRRGLYMLEVEVVTDQTHIIKAFQTWALKPNVYLMSISCCQMATCVMSLTWSCASTNRRMNSDQTDASNPGLLRVG